MLRAIQCCKLGARNFGCLVLSCLVEVYSLWPKICQPQAHTESAFCTQEKSSSTHVICHSNIFLVSLKISSQIRSSLERVTVTGMSSPSLQFREGFLCVMACNCVSFAKSKNAKYVMSPTTYFTAVLAVHVFIVTRNPYGFLLLPNHPPS